MIEMKKITMPLDLSGYDAAFTGQVIMVWVNLSAPLRQKRLELLRGLASEIASEMKKKTARSESRWFRNALWFRYARWFRYGYAYSTISRIDGMDALMAEVWSAGADEESHWTVDEIARLKSADPLLYAWMARESWRMIDEWQEARKKKS